MYRPSPYTAGSTGRDFGAMRLGLGVSRRTVAALLNVAPDTLGRWESSPAPIESALAERWRNALAAARTQRAADLAASGFTLTDLTRGTIMARQLAYKGR
jgi:hypothetical protein